MEKKLYKVVAGLPVIKWHEKIDTFPKDKETQLNS
jgi:hypothetical protein